MHESTKITTDDKKAINDFLLLRIFFAGLMLLISTMDDDTIIVVASLVLLLQIIEGLSYLYDKNRSRTKKDVLFLMPGKYFSKTKITLTPDLRKFVGRFIITLSIITFIGIILLSLV
jgi:hypothetical protein